MSDFQFPVCRNVVHAEVEEVRVAAAAGAAGRCGRAPDVPLQAESALPPVALPPLAALRLQPGPVCAAALGAHRAVQGRHQGQHQPR